MPTGVRMPVASMSIRPLIGMVQALVTPGSRTARVHRRHQPVVGHSRPPLILGLERDGGFEHVEAGGVGGGVGPAGLAPDVIHLGESA